VSGAPGELRVATFNVRAAIGPGPFPDVWWRRADRARLERIATVIGELDADVVALQEVALLNDEGVTFDQAAELGRATGMAWRYGAVRHFPVHDPEHGPDVGAGLFGNAILSRLPFRAVRTTGLPPADALAFIEPPEHEHPYAGIRYAEAPLHVREPRCLLVAELELPGAAPPLSFACTHLSHIGSGERRIQADTIARWADAATGPFVLAGDLNAAIRDPELAPLRDRLTDSFEAAGIPPGDQARTSTEDGYAIDHVLVRGLRPLDCRVIREAGDASDHYPVVATLAL